MKYVKALGLAVLAAAALMAFVGAGTASATVLCKTATDPCTEKYPAGTTIDASLEESAVLEETGGTPLVTCTASTTKGKTANEGNGSETVHGTIETLTWGGCNVTTDTIANGELELHAIAGTNNGTLTGKGSKVTVNILGVSCTYGTGSGTDLGTVTGGAASESRATIDINAVVPLIEGSIICPTTSRWTAKYIVTEPKPLWIANS